MQILKEFPECTSLAAMYETELLPTEAHTNVVGCVVEGDTIPAEFESSSIDVIRK